MKYEDGTEASCGDIVEYEKMICKVAVNVDTLEYLEGFENSLREFLVIQNTGLVVETERGGRIAIFYPNDPALKLSRRVS